MHRIAYNRHHNVCFLVTLQLATALLFIQLKSGYNKWAHTESPIEIGLVNACATMCMSCVYMVGSRRGVCVVCVCVCVTTKQLPRACAHWTLDIRFLLFHYHHRQCICYWIGIYTVYSPRLAYGGTRAYTHTSKGLPATQSFIYLFPYVNYLLSLLLLLLSMTFIRIFL